MGTLKEEMEKWKMSRYQKPMSVALKEVREGTVKEDIFDEGRMKDIYTMDQEGKSAEEIAKKLKINVKTVKGILGEETLHEFSDAQISQLKKEYEPLRGKTISGPNANKLMKIFDKFEKNKQLLVKILKANIPFVSMLAQARLIRVHGANSSQLAQMRKEELEENAAAEIQKQVAKGGMDKQMFQKSVDLLKSKKYDELKKYLKSSDTAPREYVMSTIAKKEPATFKKMYGNQTGYYSLMNQNEELQEAKAPFRLSYDDKYGKHAGFEDAKTLQDLQNKAQKLRAKGFKINKMGRNTSPVEEKLPEPEGKREVEENVGDYLKSKMNPTQIANIKKTWQMRTAKDVTQGVKDMIKRMDIPTQLAIKHAKINVLSDLIEVKDDKAYAIGMAKAKEVMKDEPPLEKKTITKAHDIAKAIKRDESINSLKGPQKTFERLWLKHKRGDKK